MTKILDLESLKLCCLANPCCEDIWLDLRNIAKKEWLRNYLQILTAATPKLHVYLCAKTLFIRAKQIQAHRRQAN